MVKKGSRFAEEKKRAKKVAEAALANARLDEQQFANALLAISVYDEEEVEDDGTMARFASITSNTNAQNRVANDEDADESDDGAQNANSAPPRAFAKNENTNKTHIRRERLKFLGYKDTTRVQGRGLRRVYLRLHVFALLNTLVYSTARMFRPRAQSSMSGEEQRLYIINRIMPNFTKACTTLLKDDGNVDNIVHSDEAVMVVHNLWEHFRGPFGVTPELLQEIMKEALLIARELNGAFGVRLGDVMLYDMWKEHRDFETQRMRHMRQEATDAVACISLEGFTDAFFERLCAQALRNGEEEHTGLVLFQPELLRSSSLPDTYFLSTYYRERFQRAWDARQKNTKSWRDARDKKSLSTILDDTKMKYISIDNEAFGSFAYIPLSFHFADVRARPLFPHLPIGAPNNLFFVTRFDASLESFTLFNTALENTDCFMTRGNHWFRAADFMKNDIVRVFADGDLYFYHKDGRPISKENLLETQLADVDEVLMRIALEIGELPRFAYDGDNNANIKSAAGAGAAAADDFDCGRSARDYGHSLSEEYVWRVAAHHAFECETFKYLNDALQRDIANTMLPNGAAVDPLMHHTAERLLRVYANASRWLIQAPQVAMHIDVAFNRVHIARDRRFTADEARNSPVVHDMHTFNALSRAEAWVLRYCADYALPRFSLTKLMCYLFIKSNWSSCLLDLFNGAREEYELWHTQYMQRAFTAADDDRPLALAAHKPTIFHVEHAYGFQRAFMFLFSLMDFLAYMTRVIDNAHAYKFECNGDWRAFLIEMQKVYDLARASGNSVDTATIMRNFVPKCTLPVTDIPCITDRTQHTCSRHIYMHREAQVVFNVMFLKSITRYACPFRADELAIATKAAAAANAKKDQSE